MIGPHGMSEITKAPWNIRHGAFFVRRIVREIGARFCFCCRCLVELHCHSPVRSIVLLLLVLPGVSCKRQRQLVVPVKNRSSASVATVRDVVATEELIIALGQRLHQLPGEIQDTWLSQESESLRQSESLFADYILVRDLTRPADEPSGHGVAELDIRVVPWEAEFEFTKVPRSQLSIWSSLKPFTMNIMDSRFYFIDATFADQSLTKLKSLVGFEGVLNRREGLLSTAQAKQRLTWEKTGDRWEITAWEQLSFRVMERTDAMFRDVLHDAIPNEADQRRATVSRHQEILVDSYFGGKPARTPKGYFDTRFFPDSVNIHPSVSVVDIDNDGWDDLYVCVRWGKNMLFRNESGRSFQEMAADYGLAIEGRSTSATFADFDNDGDQDLMLGRSLERSQYFRNEGGLFVESSPTHVDGELPFLVTSTSAADFNADGLLDIYFSTYSPLDITSRIQGQSSSLPDWTEKFLSKDQADGVRQRFADYHGFLGQVGPPNVLFVNCGQGRFRLAKESKQIEGFRNTFQSTWSDFDGDGDADLYVANDFAPDQLYRNDQSEGFTDFSQQAQTARMGFGMGAAWGDYDNDGHFDLYVSNMYSKAGRRITARVPGLDSRMVAGAEGNYLFRNMGDATFQRVSGLEPPAILVANAGWSWGGQFADFDNDGFLDLYVSSGFYTPPDDIANNVDL